MTALSTLVVGAFATGGFTATNFNSLASGSGVLAATATANSTASEVHERANVSFSFVVGGTTVAASYLSFYALPLNQDGTTYGDGYAGGASSPASTYFLASVPVLAGVLSGAAVTGSTDPVTIPAGNFKLAVVNNLGVALNAAAAAAVQIQFVDINNNG